MCVCVATHNGSLPGWQRGERLRLITVNCRRRLSIQSETKATAPVGEEREAGRWAVGGRRAELKTTARTMQHGRRW